MPSAIPEFESDPAVKWLLMSDKKQKRELVCDQHTSERISNLHNKTLHLVSIFGQARQGKSFLMNKLVGRDTVFRVTPSNKPCTVGVDIAPDFIALSRLAPAAGHSSDVVGFCDMEGQGDSGADYDVHLCAPLLLMSNAVIYNFKGKPAKDDILAKLRVLNDAASAIDQRESALPKDKKFGHLHLVFRDCADVSDVYDLVFEDEAGKDALLRNSTRNTILKAFASIHVWGLPSPVENARDLDAGMFAPSDTSSRFDAAFNQLKATILDQLKSGPKRFNGQVLTGRLVAGTMQALCAALNAGQDVLLPRSIFEQAEERIADASLARFTAGLDAYMADLRTSSAPPMDATAVETRLDKHTTSLSAPVQADLAQLTSEDVRGRAIASMHKAIAAAKTEALAINAALVKRALQQAKADALTQVRTQLEEPYATVTKAQPEDQLTKALDDAQAKIMLAFDNATRTFAQGPATATAREELVDAIRFTRKLAVSKNSEAKAREDTEAANRRVQKAEEDMRSAQSRAVSYSSSGCCGGGGSCYSPPMLSPMSSASYGSGGYSTYSPPSTTSLGSGYSVIGTYSSRGSADGRTLYEGPQGGHFYMTPSGGRRYV